LLKGGLNKKSPPLLGKRGSLLRRPLLYIGEHLSLWRRAAVFGEPLPQKGGFTLGITVGPHPVVVTPLWEGALYINIPPHEGGNTQLGGYILTTGGLTFHTCGGAEHSARYTHLIAHDFNY